MKTNNQQIASYNVLEFISIRSFTFQLILVLLGIFLPTISHLLGLPVRMLLPMHWTVILAGLVYGWRGGLLVGLLSPLISYLISGYPKPLILPSMILELTTYGILTGLLTELGKFNKFLCILIALVLGRLIFILSLITLNSYQGEFLVYLKEALLPGIFAGVFQIILLPLIANWWVKKELRYLKNSST